MNSHLTYIPEAAHSYCIELSNRYDFVFKLKKQRLTKLGDFRHDRANNQFIITVNKNLNPYQFLITLIHELAHLQVALHHPRAAKAHGKEWKTAFKELMQPVLQEAVFPEPLLSVLKKHLHNPKAAAGSDHKLWNALQAYNPPAQSRQLASLTDGDAFIFRNRKFIRVKKKRTRYLCKTITTDKLYLIPGIAEIDPV